MRRALALAALLAAAACTAVPPEPRPGGTAPDVKTTNGTIAVSNLEGEISRLESALQDGRLSREGRRALVERLSLRSQFLGRIRDYERSLELAEDLLADAPGDPEALLARGTARAALHLFEPALTDFAEAARSGLRGDSLDEARAAVFQALGRYDEALALRRSVGARDDVLSIGAEAALLGERGELDAAEALFQRAPARYRDSSPFPLAWLDFQRGLMWMRAGDMSRAHAFLQAAHDRLPQYVAATGHLGETEAALGNLDQALAHLRAAAEASDDPDPKAQLARVLDESGRGAEAAPWRERARAGFEALLAAHPQAFADHAAEFWLGAGGNPARALELARSNVALRRTPSSLRLLAQSALAAGRPDEACQATREALGLARPSPPLLALAAEAGPGCGSSRLGD